MTRPQPALSAFALACCLRGLRAAEDQAEAVYMPLAPGSEDCARAKAAWLACFDRTEACEKMVLAAEPRTLADAAAQMMMAADKIGSAIDFEDCAPELRRARRALYRCLLVIAEAAGVNLADIAFDIYAPEAEQPAGGDA